MSFLNELEKKINDVQAISFIDKRKQLHMPKFKIK